MKINNMFKKVFKRSRDPTQDNDLFKLYGLNNYDNTFTSLANCVQNNDTLESIVYTIANHCSKFEFMHKRNDDTNFRSDIKKVLKRPNDLMSRADFIQKIVMNRELFNNAFIVINKDEFGKIISLNPIQITNTRFEMLKDKNENIYIKFIFANGNSKTVRYKDVIHLRKHYSNDDFFGSKENSKLLNLLNIHESIDSATIKSLKNFNIIKWLMKFASALKKEDIDKQVKNFSSEYLDSNNNETGIIISDPRFEMERVKQEQYNPNSEIYKNAEDRIYAYFNINKKIIQSNYNETEYSAFYESVIEPIMAQLAEEMTYKLFTQTELDYNNEIVINPNMLQFASLDKRRSVASTLSQMSNTMTINEIRAMFYYPPIEGGESFANRRDRVIEELKENET